VIRVLLLLAMALGAAAQQIPGLYIVELEGEPAVALAAKAGLSRRAAAEGTAIVEAGQTRVRAALEARGARVRGGTSALMNTLTVEIADSRIDALRATPGVRRVYPVFEYRMELDYAPILHRAVRAWEAIGGEGKAGQGIKIGVIDSGIDAGHPGFQAPDLPVPEGFPKVRRESDMAFTNHKVIVARSYEDMLGAASPSAADVIGHGTALAMVAAGVRNKGPYGIITGIAPGAYLGSYKIFTGVEGRSRTDVIVRAIDDAVADGMDVINLSIGSSPAPHPERDLLYQAVERSAAAGVIVTKSAGNSGPDPGTISSPGDAPNGITVGAQWNGRFLAPSGVKVGEAPLYGALPGNGPPPPEPISGPMRDVATLDSSGLACEPLPAGSLEGHVALIFRGVCFFEVKLNNAMGAGAIAAVVYTDDRQVSRMDQVSATLPGIMVTNRDGLRIKRQIEESPDIQATLHFDVVSVEIDAKEVVAFSSRGPGSDASPKPDLVAAGVEISTAAQRTDPDGDVYSADGYTIVNGTSFAAPMAAGAAALLKGALPGRTPEQIRSLIVNSATPLVEEILGPSPVNSGGAGMLNIEAALKNTAAAFPTSLGFGAGGERADAVRQLKITNVSATTQTYSASAAPLTEGVVPDLSESMFTLEPGDSKTLTVRFRHAGLRPGAHQGFITIRAEDAGTETRVPFFYAVRSAEPAYLTIFNAPVSAATNATVSVLVRLSDAAGLPIDEIDPTVEVVAGSGRVVSVESAHGTYPGTSRVVLRLSVTRGNNVFRFRAGEIVKTLSITATAGF
jgi:minor extracellular serine protease Vpr